MDVGKPSGPHPNSIAAKTGYGDQGRRFLTRAFQRSAAPVSNPKFTCPIFPSSAHKSASDVQLPLSRRSSRGLWVCRSADAGLRYHRELTSLDEQALHRIARAAGRSL